MGSSDFMSLTMQYVVVSMNIACPLMAIYKLFLKYLPLKVLLSILIFTLNLPKFEDQIMPSFVQTEELTDAYTNVLI